MNRNKKMQILAGVALFAILFSILSTALLVIFSGKGETVPQPTNLGDFVIHSGALEKTGTDKAPQDIVLTGATVKVVGTGASNK